MSTVRWLLAVALALAACWLMLVAFVLIVRPRGLLVQEALRILPDTLRLCRRLAGDRSLPAGVRVRLWLVFVYLAIPVEAYEMSKRRPRAENSRSGASGD
jgi:hypothetical protein